MQTKSDHHFSPIQESNEWSPLSPHPQTQNAELKVEGGDSGGSRDGEIP